jgi:hypothetical protein
MSENRKWYWFWALGYVLIFLAIQVIVQIGVLLVQAIIQGGAIEQLSPVGTLAAMVAFSVASIALFVAAKWSPVSGAYLKTHPWDVVFWSSIAALGAIIPSMFIQELMPEWPEAIQRYADEAAETLTFLVGIRGSYFVICLLAPVAEEVVFRGAVLRTLLAWKPERRWLMIGLSALLFALAHLNPAQLLHPLLIGLLLGWMYERTGSIVPGIIYHLVNNTSAFLLSRAYPDPDIKLAEVFGLQSRVILAVVFSLLILVPAIYQLNMRMKPGNRANQESR